MAGTDYADGCCVPESEIMVVRDLNLSAPYKGGNQFSRVCPDCGSRTFCTRRYWETSDDQYVIPNGESDIVPLDTCPWEDCSADVHGLMESCGSCDEAITWQDGEPFALFGCPYDGCDGGVHAGVEECPGCGGELSWVDDDDEAEETTDAESDS